MAFIGVHTTPMKLADWARQTGISYTTAFRLFKSGKLPVPAEQFVTGTIIVHPEIPRIQRVVIYGRVSAADQKEDLVRQIDRLRSYAASHGWAVAAEVSEIGSGLNGHRKGLLKVLRDPSATTVLVEHRDRLARFGSEFIGAALEASGRSLVVVNETESKNDLVQDFVDVVTSMCARIYGRRSAKNKAQAALKATQT